MIKPQSDDPNVAHAAGVAAGIINEVLAAMPPAQAFDYGGHILKIGEYDVCERCTTPIAEAQAAERVLRTKAHELDDQTVKEHLVLAADLFQKEAEAAVIRAEFHNGYGTEKILNRLLGYQYDRHIGDDYQHSHHQGA